MQNSWLVIKERIHYFQAFTIASEKLKLTQAVMVENLVKNDVIVPNYLFILKTGVSKANIGYFYTNAYVLTTLSVLLCT